MVRKYNTQGFGKKKKKKTQNASWKLPATKKNPENRAVRPGPHLGPGRTSVPNFDFAGSGNYAGNALTSEEAEELSALDWGSAGCTSYTTH